MRNLLTHSEYSRVFGRKIVEREESEMRTAAINRTSATRRLNPQRYGRLLAERLPTVIRTERENEKMLAAIWELMKKGEANLSAEELALLELMSILVSDLKRSTIRYPTHRHTRFCGT
jgi:hypothetical protein